MHNAWRKYTCRRIYKGVILGTPSRESNLWELNVLLDSTKQFSKIGVSTTRIRWSICLNRIPSYLIKNIIHNIDSDIYLEFGFKIWVLLLSRILTIFLKWVLVEDVRLYKESVWVLLHWACFKALARCGRQTFLTIHRMILLYVTLPVTASTAQRVWPWGKLGGLPPNHREEAILVQFPAIKVVLPSHHRQPTL